MNALAEWLGPPDTGRMTSMKAQASEAIAPLFLGRGSSGVFTLSTGQKRVAAGELVKRYGRMVQRCIEINANTAASVDYKLFALGGNATEQKGYRGRRVKTRPVSPTTKAFLAGERELSPGTVASKRLRGNMDDIVEVTDHELLDTLEDVNPWEEGFAFRFSWFADLAISGAYFTLLADGDARRFQLWRLMPHLVRVKRDAETFVSGFDYGTLAARQTFEPDDVLWHKLFDPADLWRGVGTVEAWLRGIDADFAMEAFQDSLFRRGGSPDFMVSAPGAYPEPSKRAFRAEWRRLFGPLPERKESVGFMEYGAKIERIGQTNRELQFKDSTLQKRDELLGAFGVSKAIFTSDDVNRAAAREASPTHMRYTIWPMLCRNEDFLNQRFVPLWSDRLVLVYDNPIPRNEEVLILNRESRLRSGWSINRQLIDEGQEPIDDPKADEPLVNQGLIPLSKLGEAGLFPPGGGGEFPFDDDDPAFRRALDLAPISQKSLHLDGGLWIEQKTPVVLALVLLARLLVRAAPLAVPVIARLAALAARGAAPTAAVLVAGIRAALPILFRGVAVGAPPAARLAAAAARISARGALLFLRRLGIPTVRMAGRVLSAVAREFVITSASLVVDMEDVGAQIRDATIAAMAESGRDRAEITMGDPGWEAAYVNLMRPKVRAWMGHAAQSALTALPPTCAPLGTVSTLRAGVPRLMKALVCPEGFEPVRPAFDVESPEATAFVDDYVARLADQVAGTTRLELSRIMDAGAEAGLSPRAVADRIREIDPDVSAMRAWRTARTETARTFVEGAREAWRQSGVVQGKRWLLSPNPCQFCEALDKIYRGRSIPLNQPFLELGAVLRGTKGGRMVINYLPVQGPPLHPNCRCDLVPVLFEPV